MGASGDDDGPGDSKGAVWILSLEGDTLAPSLACPPAVLAVDAKAAPFGEFVTFTVTADDDSDPDPTVVCTPPSGSFFPRGTTMVVCTATDNAGNQSACSFPVTVRPAVRPR